MYTNIIQYYNKVDAYVIVVDGIVTTVSHNQFSDYRISPQDIH